MFYSDGAINNFQSTCLIHICKVGKNKIWLLLMIILSKTFLNQMWFGHDINL